MGPQPSAWVPLVAIAALLCGCNALLGTPEPELAPDAGGAETSTTSEGGADVDATMSQDAPTPQDGAMPQDATTQDALGLDGSGPDTLAQDVVVVDAGSDATPPLPPPSCAGDGGPGITSCGTAADSCCASVRVTGGSYYRTVTTGFNYQASVSDFRLDKYEVTVGRFRQFVDASKTWQPPPGSGVHTYLRDGGGLEQVVDGAAVYEPGWSAAWNADLSQSDGGGLGHWDGNLLFCGVASTWTDVPSTQENLPINCLNWYEAYAFCIWDGGFLPSEAEWGYAAAGGSQQREYPWGGTDPGLINQYAIYGCDYPDGGQLGVDAAGTCNSIANIAPVGSAPLGVGRWQQLDLGGNVHEPVLDWYSVNYPFPCGDCAELAVPSGPLPTRSVRGGSWWVQPGAMLTYARADFTPSFRDYKAGVRCARAP